MLLLLLLSFFLLGASSVATLSSTNNNGTTARLHLTRHGFAYASIIAQSSLQHLLPSIRFPDISHRFNDGPGHGLFTISSLHIDATALQSPPIAFQLTPSNVLVLNVDGGSILIRGYMSVWYKWIGAKVTFVGNIRANIERIQLHMKTSFVRELNGSLTMRVDECRADIGAFRLRIDSRYRWITDLFRPKLSSQMRQSIRDKLCPNVKDAFVDTINKQLKSMPMHVPIGYGFYLDYSIDSLSIPTIDLMQFDVNASVMHSTTTTQCSLPTVDVPLDTTTKSNRMMQLWLSDRLVGCLFESLHSSHLISLIIDYEHIPDSRVHLFLRTTCDGLLPCVGRVIPQIGKLYLNHYIDIVMNSLRSPTIIVHPNVTSIDVALTADLYLSPWINASLSLVRLSVQFNSTIDHIDFIDHKLRAQLHIDNIDVKVIKSTIGTVSDEICRTIALILKPMLQIVANEIVDRGIRLPIVDGFTLTNTNVSLMSRTIRFDTDLLYSSRRL